ncbi:MAG TPA: protein-L-isoaspartate(D-aspartate) O-methyltransferase [Dehalococcoidia bacterium]|nr:protein-L-isoaspartate(D-aspartate) O-methyltransferase [Dehalococcoidia bacterium]
MTSSARHRMVQHINSQVRDQRVLDAMRDVPRHEFVPSDFRHLAYEDSALRIGHEQTISQPLIVAIMTAALDLQPSAHVLEIGTGSGYQAAVLARLVATVVSVERIDALRTSAATTLARLGCDNVRSLAASDELGAPEHGPYDAIIVTAAAPETPSALLGQLRIGGRMVIPLGPIEEQELTLITRTADGSDEERLGPCRFVPLLGPGGYPDHIASGRWPR